jgi:hypothetical protein
LSGLSQAFFHQTAQKASNGGSNVMKNGGTSMFHAAFTHVLPVNFIQELEISNQGSRTPKE